MSTLQLVTATASQLTADAVALAATPGAAPPALGPGAGQVLASLGFAGKAGQVVLVPASAFEADLAATVVAVAGMGAIGPDGPRLEQLRRAAGNASRAMVGQGSAGLAFGYDDAAQVGAIAEGAALGAYQFTRYRTPDQVAPAVLLIAVAEGSKALMAAVERAGVVAEAVAGVRDLVNTPGNELFPASFGQAAAAAAKASGVKVKVMDLAELTEGGFGGMVAVGQGSVRPPCLVKLSYTGRRAKAHVALVGKGITFDSGGLSLKTAKGMATMKSDMAGAAAVLHTVCAAAQLKLPVKVTGYLALAENMPSGAAQHPADVITMKGGKTVEVTNTDAEGRLVLADAITAALEEEPDVVIDIATLTGAQGVALGNRVSGVMGTEAVRQAVLEAAELAGEAFWPMPLPAHLRDTLKSEVADLLNYNMAEPNGGMLTAGLFLKEFAGEHPWAHLDIAYPAFNEGEAYDYVPAGGTGVGVRTLLAYLTGQVDQ